MDQRPLACVDVGYQNDQARAACVTFEQWDSSTPLGEYTVDIDEVAPYQPGAFYRRELPCVMTVLEQLPDPPTLLVIDGYVWLDASGRPGLGAHLYEELKRMIPIIGVAKTEFGSARQATELKRGNSERPLFVTAVGISQTEAVHCIEQMHGEHRIPTLLKRVDQLSHLPVSPDPSAD